MFPICNDMEQVIAFSGRILEADAKAAKYVNSPETILFTKGAVLFGLHKSKRAIIEKSSAIVCEGQIDLITIFEAGVPNVIAPQGTAFTDKQARMLKRFVQDGEVVLCFDADAAGQKAAERSTAVLLTENLAVRIVEMPAGEDPDSLIRSQGAPAFLERVAAARSFFDFQIDRLASRPGIRHARRAKTGGAEDGGNDQPHLGCRPSRGGDEQRHAPSRHLDERVRPPAQSALASESRRRPAGSRRGAAAPLDPAIRILAHVALHDAGAREWLLAEPWERLLKDDPEAAILYKILAADFHPEDQGSIHALLGSLSAGEEAVVSGLAGRKAASQCHAECQRLLAGFGAAENSAPDGKPHLSVEKSRVGSE